MSLENIDWAAVRAEAEAEVIADKTAEILADADAYECVACCIEGQLCDVGLAVRVERERIIKLLEKMCSEINMNRPDYAIQIEDAIALIKGEQK